MKPYVVKKPISKAIIWTLFSVAAIFTFIVYIYQFLKGNRISGNESLWLDAYKNPNIYILLIILLFSLFLIIFIVDEAIFLWKRELIVATEEGISTYFNPYLPRKRTVISWENIKKIELYFPTEIKIFGMIFGGKKQIDITLTSWEIIVDSYDDISEKKRKKMKYFQIIPKNQADDVEYRSSIRISGRKAHVKKIQDDLEKILKKMSGTISDSI